MKTKLVLLPLDERPCNYFFPERLFSDDEIEIIKPDKLGYKKQPACFDEIRDFLMRECKTADGLILSFDMLMYGGLIPSRIHHQSKEQLLERLELVRVLKEENPNLLVYGFNVIMRCPNYSSDDEEPDYYLFCGKEIHDLGVAIHKSRAGIENDISVEKAMEQVDKKILEDYINRREINRYMNVEILQLAREGLIEGLIIPQDDAASYGYAAIDQLLIKEKITEYNLTDKVLIYPGADEVELTLISRMINKLRQTTPLVFPKYFSDEAKRIIPLYEGAYLNDTVVNHIKSAGCLPVDNEDEADIILFITAPSDLMKEAITQPCLESGYADRDMDSFVEWLKTGKNNNKIIVIADNAYANGGDLSIVEVLDDNNMLLFVDGYAGWNTSANTIGTTIAEAVFVKHFGKSALYEKFLIERYLEDAGYCGKIRGEVTNNLPEAGMSYFDVKDTNGIVSFIIADRLKDFMYRHLHSISGGVNEINVTMPWKRMFEIDLVTN